MIVAAVLLTVICVVGFNEGKRRDRRMISAPPLVGIWSLLTFYHLTYGFLLLLPTAAWLLFSNDESTERLRRGTFWAMQIALMCDVVTSWRWFGAWLGLPGWLGAVAQHGDQLLMLALLGSMFVLHAKTRDAASAGPLRS